MADRILRLHRNQDLICSDNGIDGEYSESRGTIYENLVVIAFVGFNSIRKNLFSREYTGKPWFIFRQADIGWNQIYALIMVKYDIFELHRFLPDR